METTQALNGTFAQLAESLQNNNDAAMQVLAEHNSMPAKQSDTEQPPLQATEKQQNLEASKKARRVYESGISENVTHGEQVVDYLITQGLGYNPSNVALSIVSLQAKNLQGRTYINSVQDEKQGNKQEIDARQDVYGNLKTTATAVLNETIASGAPKNVVKDAKHYVDKIHGQRIIKKDPSATDKKYISACQTSFSQQVDHLNGLIGVVSAVPEYDPNVPTITVQALEDKRDAMIAANAANNMSQAKYSTSIVDRNKFFNEEYTGYVDTYSAVKRAVKAIYGSRSPQYYQISAFAFAKIRD